VRETLTRHGELEMKEGRAIDYSIPVKQKEFEDNDAVCKMMGPEIEW
jgi:hypothetical protein